MKRLTWIQGAEIAVGELAAVPSNLFEAFALAVKIAAERHAENFGVVESSKVHAEKFRQIAALRDRLLKEISSAYTADDLTIGMVGSDGRGAITLKISGGAVSLGPVESLGERLINWLCNHPEAVKQLRKEG